MANRKVWLESRTGENNQMHFGLASALGATVSDLPTENVPQGSDALDYTTGTIYLYDGVSWKEVS